jgi:hypothetical protein
MPSKLLLAGLVPECAEKFLMYLLDHCLVRVEYVPGPDEFDFVLNCKQPLLFFFGFLFFLFQLGLPSTASLLLLFVITRLLLSRFRLLALVFATHCFY